MKPVSPTNNVHKTTPLDKAVIIVTVLTTTPKAVTDLAVPMFRCEGACPELSLLFLLRIGTGMPPEPQHLLVLMAAPAPSPAPPPAPWAPRLADPPG